MNWNKKDIINMCKVVAVGILLYWALENLGSIYNVFKVLCEILKPFIMGIAIAFVVNIPMTIFEKKVFVLKKKDKKKKNEEEKVSKLKRVFCIIISFIIIIIGIIGIIFLVIPELINVLGDTISGLPALFSDSKGYLSKIANDHPEFSDNLKIIQANIENFNTEVIKELTSIATGLVTSSFGIISSTISMILNLLIAIIFSIYILMGKEKMILQLKRITYATMKNEIADKVCKIATLSRDSFYNFVTGQFIECIILGSLCAIGMIILRIPYAATIGGLVALTAFIPIVGALIGGFVGVILLLSISLKKSITFLIFFIILQQIEGNIIYPKVVGGKVGVPGALVLIALAIGNSIGGVVGMVMCLPITSVLYTLLKEFTDRRLKEKNLE